MLCVYCLFYESVHLQTNLLLRICPVRIQQCVAALVLTGYMVPTQCKYAQKVSWFQYSKLTQHTATASSSPLDNHHHPFPLCSPPPLPPRIPAQTLARSPHSSLFFFHPCSFFRWSRSCCATLTPPWGPLIPPCSSAGPAAAVQPHSSVAPQTQL